MLGVTRQRVHIISRRKGFPDPVSVLAMGSVWLKSDVEEWIRQYRPHQSDD